MLTALALHRAGQISSSELHATGSPNVLPKGWYYYYVNDELRWCPTRVWGLDELAGDGDMAKRYEQGYRWILVFSDATGPRGDRTFLHIQNLQAAAMTENPLTEADALHELADMGYRFQDLPDDIRIHSAAPAPPPQRPAGIPTLRAELCTGGGTVADGRLTPRTGSGPSPTRFEAAVFAPIWV